MGAKLFGIGLMCCICGGGTERGEVCRSALSEVWRFNVYMNMVIIRPDVTVAFLLVWLYISI